MQLMETAPIITSGDSNPNVSSYNFTAKITDDTVQVVLETVDIQLGSRRRARMALFFPRLFVRTGRRRKLCV